MYTRAFLSLAIGLIGFDAVAASPCKPLTSKLTASIISSASLTSTAVSTSVESLVTDISTSAESSATNTLTSNAAETTTTDFTPLITTSADTTTVYTTGTSAATTDVITTAPDTTTAETMTTTSEAPVTITTFAVLAGSGPASGAKLKSDNTFGTPLYFASSVTFPAQHYNLDTATGHLMAGTMSVCASFQHSDQTKAYITACSNDNLNSGVVFLTCQASSVDGASLQCSVPVLNCVQLGGGQQNCAATTESLTKFSIEGDVRMLYIVSDDFTGINQTPVDLVVGEAHVAAPTP
ncbi:hypothetical protein FBEOM_477 [Fusarium beomiforme]|uniref:Uncharacterized protein n=1 Tax=Fusarium beomiforme TaxID=44412 RepID=A0A9P5AVY0_9HYPO|nr:hypothetical protein FBEOM_477 [Fusarium beomiforme]